MACRYGFGKIIRLTSSGSDLTEDRIVQRFLLVAATCLGLAACGDDEALTRGAKLYAKACAICHGADLRGGGGAGVEGLSGAPSDLTVLSGAAGGAFPRDRVIEILGNYAAGRQTGRAMRPFSHLTSEDTTRIRTDGGRTRLPRPQADLLRYLEASQRP